MHRVLFSFGSILRRHSFVLRFRDTEITSSKLSVLKELCIALLFSVWKTWCQRIIFTENAFTRNCKFIKFAKEIFLRILLKLSGLKAKILLPHSFKPRKKFLARDLELGFVTHDLTWFGEKRFSWKIALWTMLIATRHKPF